MNTKELRLSSRKGILEATRVPLQGRSESDYRYRSSSRRCSWSGLSSRCEDTETGTSSFSGGVRNRLLVEDVLDISCLRGEQLHKKLGIFKSQVTNPSVLAPNPGLFTQILSEIEVPWQAFPNLLK